MYFGSCLERCRTTSEVPPGSGTDEGNRWARLETRVHLFSIAIFIFCRFYAVVTKRQLCGHRVQRDELRKQSDRFGGPGCTCCCRLVPMGMHRNAWVPDFYRHLCISIDSTLRMRRSRLWEHRAPRDELRKQSDRFGGPGCMYCCRLVPMGMPRNACNPVFYYHLYLSTDSTLLAGSLTLAWSCGVRRT